MLYRLIVLTGPLRNQRITVDREPMTIGRAPDCQILIPDDEVALKHAVLEDRGEGGLHLRDLGTMYKIIVNGRELRQARLKHGDMVEIGRTRFLVQAVVAADVTGKYGDEEDRTNPKLIGAVALVVALAVITWLRWPVMHPKAAAPRALPEPPVIAAVTQTNDIPDSKTNAPVETIAIQATNQVPVVVTAVETGAPEVVAVSARPPAPVAPPVENQTTQMTAEIQRIRQDLLTMRESIKDLTRPPAVTTAPPSFAPGIFTSPPPVIVITTAPPVSMSASSVVATAGSSVATGASSEPKSSNPPTNLPTRPPVVSLTNRIVASVPADSSATNAPVGRVIRVLNVEQSRFQASEDFDDMRTFNIVLSQTNPRVDIANTDVRIEMTFFDEDQNDGSVHPSSAVVPMTALRPTQAWGAERRCSVSTTYVLPKGTRAKGKAAGFDGRYYGFTVRVFYRDMVQDEWALPRALLGTPNGALPPASGVNTAESKHNP
jgi:hypothetical protein